MEATKTLDGAVIAVHRDPCGGSGYVIRASEGEAGALTLERMAELFAQYHAEQFPDAPRPNTCLQILDKVGGMLVGADAACMDTPWGRVLFYDCEAMPGHVAQKHAERMQRDPAFLAASA